jgi:hypothetical protein
LKIRIPKIDGEDFAACNPDPEGIFSVRNAYNSALMNRSNTSGNGSSTNPNGERKLWDLIWKANVPPKIRVFGWKLASRNKVFNPTLPPAPHPPNPSHRRRRR